jgi:hypothetical protein
MLTTNQLKAEPVDGSVFVGYDGLYFHYWGMTEQAGGDMLVHLEVCGFGIKREIEVPRIDLDEKLWD